MSRYRGTSWHHGIVELAMLVALVGVGAGGCPGRGPVSSDGAARHDAGASTGVPRTAWVQTISGCTHEFVADLAFDSQGRLAVVGAYGDPYRALTLPTAFGPSLRLTTGRQAAFVAELDAAGRFAKVTTLASSDTSSAIAMAIDSADNVYIGGAFAGTIGLGGVQLTASDLLGDDFLAKVGADGKTRWARQLRGVSIAALAVDPSGDLVVTGHLIGKATLGKSQLTPTANGDAVVAKLSKGGSFVWAAQVRDKDRVFATGLAVDGSGASYLVGSFFSSASFGGHVLDVRGAKNDAYIAKLDGSGAFRWARSVAAGPNEDLALDVALDRQGNAHVAGLFGLIPPPAVSTARSAAHCGPFKLTTQGNSDAFVAKVAPDGTFLWAASGGGRSVDDGTSLVVNGSGEVFVAGHIEAQLAPTQARFGAVSVSLPSASSAFVAALSSAGTFTWARAVAGRDASAGSRAHTLAMDPKGALYLSGSFEGAVDFLGTTVRSANCTQVAKNNTDAFIWKLLPGGG